MFQALTRLRRREARVLLKAGENAGAYYLAGYAIECALKASIAKLTERHEFPDRSFAQNIHTHNLDRLLELSGLKAALEADMKASGDLEKNWRAVRDWSETARYNAGLTRTNAEDLYSACTARRDGVLPWIVKRW